MYPIGGKRVPEESFSLAAEMRSCRIRVDADAALPVEGDGDLIGATPLEVTVVPHVLSVVVPGDHVS
jgi:diacylglycerol kinase family enzyme